MTDFPSDSDDENLTDLDEDPHNNRSDRMPDSSSSGSDLEDPDEDEFPLAHLVFPTRSGRGKVRPKWT